MAAARSPSVAMSASLVRGGRSSSSAASDSATWATRRSASSSTWRPATARFNRRSAPAALSSADQSVIVARGARSERLVAVLAGDDALPLVRQCVERGGELTAGVGGIDDGIDVAPLGGDVGVQEAFGVV